MCQLGYNLGASHVSIVPTALSILWGLNRTTVASCLGASRVVQTHGHGLFIPATTDPSISVPASQNALSGPFMRSFLCNVV